MNSKKTSQIFFLLLIIQPFYALADMAASAKMSANSALMAESVPELPKIKINDVIAFYKSEQKKRKLTTEESDLVNLAQTAKDVFSVTETSTDHYEAKPQAPKEKTIRAFDIAIAIQNIITQKSDWDKTLSPSDSEKLKQVSETIKTALGAKSFAWAWISYQQGDKDSAKKILIDLFEANYKSLMELKHIGFDPPDSIEKNSAISKILTPLTSEEDKKERESKIKKMKVHLSNLPDMQIMT